LIIAIPHVAFPKETGDTPFMSPTKVMVARTTFDPVRLQLKEMQMLPSEAAFEELEQLPLVATEFTPRVAAV